MPGNLFNLSTGLLAEAILHEVQTDDISENHNLHDPEPDSPASRLRFLVELQGLPQL